MTHTFDKDFIIYHTWGKNKNQTSGFPKFNKNPSLFSSINNKNYSDKIDNDIFNYKIIPDNWKNKCENCNYYNKYCTKCKDKKNKINNRYYFSKQWYNINKSKNNSIKIYFYNRYNNNNYIIYYELLDYNKDNNMIILEKTESSSLNI